MMFSERQSSSGAERRDQLQAIEGKVVRIVGRSWRREVTHPNLELGKSRDRFRGRVLVSVVVSNVGTPLLPSLRFRSWFTLELGESRNGIRRGVLVGVVISDVGTPLFPSLWFGGGLTLELGESGDGVGRGILASVVVPNIGAPLLPSLGFGERLALVQPRTRKAG